MPDSTERRDAAYVAGRDCARCGSTPDSFGFCRCADGPKIDPATCTNSYQLAQENKELRKTLDALALREHIAAHPTPPSGPKAVTVGELPPDTSRLPEVVLIPRYPERGHA